MDIDHANRSLRNFLTLVEKGDWDRIAESADELISILDRLRTWEHVPGNATTGQQAREIVVLLGEAISACSERQAQIAPLIEALSRVEKQPTLP